MKRNAVLASLVTLLVAFSAHAVTYDVRIAFDTDRNAATGCTVTSPAGSFTGAEQVVNTRVDATGGTATTFGVTRQACVGGVIGSALPIDPGSWPAGLTTTGNLFIETHVTLAELGMSSIAPMRIAFFVTNGTLNDSVMATRSGNPLLWPQPGRHHAVAPTPAPPRTITLDGSDADWDGIPPVAGGGGGTADMRILNGFAFGTATDLFFAVRLQANHNAPTAVDDAYVLETVGGTLNVDAGSGVLANDSDPNSLPLSAVLIAGVQHGTLTLNSNGSFTYANDGSNAPVDTFEYKATNGTLDSNVAQVQIGVGAGGGPNPPLPPTFTSADHATFNAGEFNTFTVNVTPLLPAVTITATFGMPPGVTLVDNGDSTATLSGTPPNGSGGVYQFGIKAKNEAGETIQLFTLTVNETATAPVVTTDPSPQTVCTGATATFTAAATGLPSPSVQWQVSTDGGGTFTDIIGATNPTLSFIVNPAQNGNLYRAVFTNPAGTATTTAALLTVTTPAVVTTHPLSQTICAGSPVTFTAAASGTPAPTVQWQVDSGSGFANIPGETNTSLTFVTAASDNAKQYRAVFTNACGTANTNAATLTVNVAPVVTTQPTAQIVCAGATATFTAAASGTPAPTVQWQVDSGSGFSDIPGATSTTLAFATVAGDNGKQYRAVFTNSCGTATSNAVLLTVNTAPVVTTNPLTQTVCAGSSATFTAAASASPAATVQWQVDSGSGIADIPGATATTLTFVTTAGQSGNQYRAVFTNTCGTATTTAATLTVNVAPAVITQPTAQIVCAGATANFTSTASGTPAATVQWQVDSGSGFSDIPGATSTTLSFATVAGDNGKQYRAVFTNSCGTATSNAVNLRVDTLPVVSTNPLTQTICAGSPVTFTAAATSNAGETVQWQVDSGSGFTDITGETNTSLTFVTAAADNTKQYRAVFTNSCGTATTTAATLVVDTLPVVTTNPLSQAVCVGGTATFTAAATSNASDHTVQWQVDSGSGFTDIPGETTTTLSFVVAAADNGKQYRAVFTNACGSSNTTAATLTADTLPVVNTNPLTQTVCAGATATFTAAATSNAGQTVQWQVDSGSGFTDIPGATSTTLAFTAAAGDNGKQYRAVFTNSCGSVNSSAATLTVDTLPVITTNPLSQAVCTGGTATFTAAATSNASDHTVKWQVDSGSGFTDIPGETTTTLSFTVAPADNGKQYRAVFTTACGSTNTTAATLTVNTPPVVTTNPLSQTVCALGNATFTAAASGLPVPTVQWQVDIGSGFTDIPGATSTTLSFATTIADNGNQYRARFTNTCGADVATTAATLTVDTLPVVTLDPVSQIVCEGGTATFTAAATSNASNHTVQWQVDSGSGFADIPGETSTTLAFTVAAADNGKQYRAVFTTACGSTNTTAATLTVDTLPVVTTNPLTQTVCAGATATFTAAATSNAGNHTVQWQVDSGSGFTDIPGETTTTLSFTAAAGDNGKQYRAVFTTSCGSTNTTAATLTVDTLPVVTTNPLTQTVCAGATATFTAAATSNASNHTVQWQVDSGSGFTDIPGETSTTLAFTAAAGDNGKQYRAVFTTSCGTATTTAATLTVDTLPVVTTNPLTQTVCAGATATFTAAATSNASNHTVQWQVDSGSGFTDIPGETTTTLSFTAAAGDNGKQYRAVFTTSCGSTNTTAATLTVDTLPVVTTNPLTQTVCAGATATFTAAATSNASNHTVQWQVDSGSGFTDIPGEITTTLSFTAAAGDNGKQYRAVFTTSCGTATTTAATLTVDTLPVVTLDPVNQTVCAGATATFTAAATSNAGNHTVKWQVDSGSGFTDIPGETTTTLSFATVAGDNGKLYRAVFTTSCGSTNTAAATLTVDVAPAVTLDPVNSTVCENTVATFTATASGSPLPTVQWEVSTDGGTIWNPIPSETSTTLSFTAAAIDNTKQYRAVFTNSCGTATTAAATLTVNTAPAVTTHPTNQTVQSGNTATFTAAASGSPTPTAQWEVSTDGGTIWNPVPGATNTTLSFTAALSQDNNQYRAVFTNTCGTATTNAATLDVTCPTITVSRTGGGAFPNGTFNVAYTGESVTATGGTAPYNFSVTAGALPTNLLLATDGTISGTPNVTGVFNFTVSVTDASGCPGSQAFTISVGPAVTGESYNNVGNTHLIGFNFPAPGTPHVSNAQSLLANDSGPGLAVTVVTDAATTQGGKITTMADGSFSYTPPANFTGTDTYNYIVTSNGVGTQGTVSFVMNGKVWYVKNNHGVAGTGVSNDPFQALASAETASAAGDTIYVMTGDGTTLNQNAGITLKATQTLHGAGTATLIVSTITITTPGAGTKPLIGHTTGSAVTLANGNTLTGFTATTTTGTGVNGITGTALTTGPTIDNVNAGPTTADGLNISNSGTITTSLTNVAISGAGGTGINMNDFDTLTINAGVTVAGVQALALTGTNDAAGSTVNGTFGTVTATGGTNGIFLSSLDGTITIPAGSSLSGASGDEFFIGGNTPGINVTYQGNITYSGAGSAIRVNVATGIHTGSLTFDTGTLTVTGGTGINIITASGTCNFYTTTGSATINGAAAGVNLGVNSNGSYTFGQAATPASFSITNTTSTSFTISTTAADVVYNGNMSQAVNAATLLSFVSHNSSGFATFQNGTLTASTGAGIAMADADGPVTFSGVVTLSGTAGVVIRQGSGGTINFSNASSAITSTGTPFTVRGDVGGGNNPEVNGNITYSGTINKTSTGTLLDVNTLSGSLTFNGSQLTGASNGAPGVVVNISNITGTLTTNHLNLDSSNANFGPDELVNISGVNSGTMTFHHMILQALGTSSRGSGLVASGGGTVTVTNTGGNSSISTRDAPALSLTGVALGTSSINSVSVIGGANTVNAVAFTTVTGSLTISAGSLAGATGPTFLVSGGTVTVTNGATVSQANNAATVSVTGGHATGALNFNANVTATNGTGLQFSDADGIYNFNATTALNGTGDEGIDILLGSSGTFGFASTTSITNPSGIAFNMSASAPASMSYAGTISHNAGRAVSINGDTDPGAGVTAGGCGATTTFSGNITNIGASATGILVTNCNAGTITFSGTTKTFSTQTNQAITLTTNAGATIAFNGGNLSVTTTTAAAFTATGGGTINVSGTLNTLTSGTGTALNASSGTMGMTWRSITANGGANGIVLNATSGSVSVTGDGTNLANGSGGSLSNIGTIALANHRAIHMLTVNGTASFSSMNIGISTLADGGVYIDNNASGTLAVTFTGCIFTGVTASVSQQKALLQYESGNSANLTGNVQNCFFNGSRTYGFFATGAGASQLNITLNQSGFGTDVNTGAAVNKPGTTITNAPAIGMAMTYSTSADVAFTVTNNTFWGASGAAGAVYAVTFSGASATASASMTGSFSGNQIGKAGTLSSGCSTNCGGIGLLVGTNGTFNATLNNNDIRQVNSEGMVVFAPNGGSVGTTIAHITNNTLAEPDTTGGPLFQRGIVVTTGNSGGATLTACAEITGNNISGGWTLGSRIRVSTLNASGVLTISGMAAGPATGPQVDTYLEGANTIGGANNANTTVGGAINGSASPCP